MYDIITIGSATQDVFLEGVDFVEVKDPGRFRVGKGICLPYGGKIRVSHLTYASGGGGTNTAVTFARQGLKTAAIIRIGEDVSGEIIRRELAKEKVDTKLIQVDPKVPTAYSAVFLLPTGERTILTYKGAGETLKEREIPWKKIKCRWIFVGSLQKNFSLLKKILKFARRQKIFLATNPGGRDLLILKKNPKLLNYYDVVILNKEEASFLTDIAYVKEKELFKRLDDLVEGVVVMTKGKEGLTVSDGAYLWQVGIYKEKRILDRTGAGDAFAAGFTAGLIQNQKLKIKNKKYISKIKKEQNLKTNRTRHFSPEVIEYAIRLGSANSTSVIEHIGAKYGIITKKDFKASRWRKLKIKRIKL